MVRPGEDQVRNSKGLRAAHTIAAEGEGTEVTEHGTRTTHGHCCDCTQGMITNAVEGFEYWDEDGEGRGFWFCRYCGSNDVSITRDDGFDR